MFFDTFVWEKTGDDGNLNFEKLPYGAPEGEGGGTSEKSIRSHVENRNRKNRIFSIARKLNC